MIHFFPEDFVFEEPQEFTDPFRYTPHPAVRTAAELIMQMIEDSGMASDFAEGKMLGVLVCRPSAKTDSPICYIAAFSGNVGSCSKIDGFVPPIYDLTDPSGEFKRREAEISALNAQIGTISRSDEYLGLKQTISEAEADKEIELDRMKSAMTESKKLRNELRSRCTDETVLAGLIKESQHEKAELRRLKQLWDEKISALRVRLNGFLNEIDSLRRLRASMSESLQDWIFRQYIVHNALGEEASIADIFADGGLTPPGGTGECAAPKLLEYAYRNGLEPLAMGEFWYGKDSETAVRLHGRFYPSCTSKCGPLLGFMLKGLSDSAADTKNSSFQSYGKNSILPEEPIVLYEDETVIVVEKPSGIPSVPGLDGRMSLLEWLSSTGLETVGTKTDDSVLEVHPVHRLDMDTSGVLVFAKTAEAAVNLRRQFEEHSIRKTYMARLSCQTVQLGGTGSETTPPKQAWAPPPAARGVARFQNLSLPTALPRQSEGYIELPLSPDYDERPRQKVDFRQGKPAHTKYETVSEHPDGTADLILHPHTGRTHQLRVHCAHSLGLARPILGDLLYGGDPAERLHLHALSITFTHPSTGEIKTFVSKQLCYDTTPTK